MTVLASDASDTSVIDAAHLRLLCLCAQSVGLSLAQSRLQNSLGGPERIMPGQQALFVASRGVVGSGVVVALTGTLRKSKGVSVGKKCMRCLNLQAGAIDLVKLAFAPKIAP
jgi:hypothetical protein